MKTLKDTLQMVLVEPSLCVLEHEEVKTVLQLGQALSDLYAQAGGASAISADQTNNQEHPMVWARDALRRFQWEHDPVNRNRKIP